MPDFERLTDSLRLHMTKDDPTAKARAEGYIAGKTTARTQIAVVWAVTVTTILVLKQYGAL